MSTDQLLDNLKARGLLFQSTEEAALREHLSTPRKVYCGFDPTADSLTIGNLVPITVLRHFQQAGHTPVVIMGGGTGLIGDPSGKSAERQLLPDDAVASNVRSQMRIFQALLDFSPERANKAVLLNNADWLTKLSYIEVLRTIGKHLSVNEMIKRDSVRDRLAREQGLSYTEFSYLVLQAFDFLFLYQRHGVTIQIGGSDQWGNIVAGVNLIKKSAEISANQAVASAVTAGANAAIGNIPAAQAAVQRANEQMARATAAGPQAITMPLITKSDGGKFGKSEAGAVWLTPERTSPYAFYQFWLNAHDDDAIRFLRIFSFLPLEQIAEIERVHKAEPQRREAQRALARSVTATLHGEAAMRQAEAAAGALFGGASSDAGESQDFTKLDRATLSQLFANAPATDHPRALLAGDGITLVDLLPMTTLAKSKREAREHLAAGAVSVNGIKSSPDDRLTVANLLHDEVALLRRGKKSWHVTRWR